MTLGSLPLTYQDYASSLPSISQERTSFQPGKSVYEEYIHLFGFNSSLCRRGKDKKQKQK